MRQRAIERKKREAKQIRTEHGALIVSMAGAVFFLVAEILMAIYTTSQSILMDAFYGVFLLSRPVSKQLLDIVREQVLLISCFAADSPIKYQ